MTDQLRTIHLTLLLICLVLLAASFAEHRGPLKRAHEDAMLIQKWASRTSDVIKPFLSQAASRFSHNHSSVAKTSDHQDGLPYLRLSVNGDALVTLNRHDRFFYGTAYDKTEVHFQALNEAESAIYSWETLEDFIQTWNVSYLAIENPLLDHKFDSRQVVSSTCGSVTIEPAAASAIGLFMNPIVYNSSTSEVKLHVDFDLPRKPGTCELNLPMGKIESARLDLRGVLQSMVDGPLTTASFNEAFPDLSETTKHLTSLRLDDLEMHLRDQANKEGDKLELLGAKIPYDLVSIFGALALIGCQFYLWCHLVAFTAYLSTEKTTDTMGYIGLYTDKLAIRAFTELSVSIVPFGVLALTLWSMRRDELWRWITPTVALPIALFLGWLLILRFRKVWLIKATAKSAAVQQAAASVGKP